MRKKNSEHVSQKKDDYDEIMTLNKLRALNEITRNNERKLQLYYETLRMFNFNFKQLNIEQNS